MTCDVRGAVRGQGELDEIFAAKPDVDSLPTRETRRSWLRLPTHEGIPFVSGTVGPRPEGLRSHLEEAHP